MFWEISIQQAKDLATANMTPEAAAARMTPEEAKRLSQVRNIGIAVGHVVEAGLGRKKADED